MSNLSGLVYGNSHQQDIAGETTRDTTVPPGGDGYFYLVTAENRLGEEGSKGTDSGRMPRGNSSPCP
jgi:hypothetical protein